METDKLIKIIDGLKSPRELTRVRAMEDLMRIDDPAVVKELFHMVRREGDYIKVQFCRFLGNFRGDEAVLPLAIFLASDSDKVAREAAAALDTFSGEIKDNALITFLRRVTPPFVKRYAIEALGRERVAKAVPYLVDILQGHDRELKKLAIESLRLIGDTMAIPYMAKRLGREDEEITYALILAIGELGGEEAAKAIGRFLGHEDPCLRRAAVWALYRLGCRRCIPQMVEMLVTDDDENVREEIAKRIGALAGASCVEPLLRAGYCDPASNVRAYAVWSIRNLPLGEIEGQLLDLTENRDACLRSGAILELAQTGEARFLKVLERAAARDKSEEVRKCAHQGCLILKKNAKGGGKLNES